MITLIIVQKRRRIVRIMQTIIMAATTTSEVFCSYKSQSICSITLFYEIWYQTGEFVKWKVSVLPYVSIPRTNRSTPAANFIIRGRATVLPSSAPGYEWSQTKHILLMLQSFLYFCLFSRCICPFNSLLLSHLPFHFSQQFCIIVLMQTV
jgi:hypothetical protein